MAGKGVRWNVDASTVRTAQTSEDDREVAAAVTAILVQLRPLVRRLVRGYPLPQHDDLCQAGLLAVVNALATFDPTKGARFETYAYRAASNAVADEAYQLKSSIRVPSRTAYRYGQVIDATQSDDEIGRVAPEHGMSAALFYDVRRARNVEPLASEGEPLRIDASEPVAAATTVYAILGQLTEVERSVLTLAYGLLDAESRREVLTEAEIADRLGMTVAGVKKAKRRAKDKLGEALAVIDQG